MKAFLITPFGADSAGNERPDVFQEVQLAIRAAVGSAGLRLVHPAEMQSAGPIMDQVREAVQDADLVIGLLTGQNPNVLYELGIALESASRMPLIVARSQHDVPFDLRHYRVWTYGEQGELQTLEARLLEAIRDTLALTPRRFGGGGRRQPLLDRRVLPSSVRSPLNFRSRATPFLGREKELAQINAFLVTPELFRWQSVHGPGGVGKSRLALEFCLSLDAWSAGFLPPGNGFEKEWNHWSPERPTLIVIDDLEQRTSEAKAILQTMSLKEQVLEQPVRVLLLGREKSKNLEKILSVDPFDWESHFESSCYGPAIALGPVSSVEAERIIHGIAGNLARAGPLDGLFQLPLYAILAGIALENGKNPFQWDRSALSRYVLGRNRSQFWRNVNETDENLLAYVSIVGPMSPEFLSQLSDRELFPKNEQEALSHNQILTGGDEVVLMPLNPGPLGEFFVLDIMAQAQNPADVTDRGHRLADAALRRPIVSTDFTLRAMLHFPDHPALPRLIAAMVPRFDEQLNLLIPYGVPALVDGAADLVREGNVDLARAFVRAVDILEKRRYGGIILAGYRDAAFNLASALADRGDMKEAVAVIDELEGVTFAGGGEIDSLGKAYANTIISAKERSSSLALQLLHRLVLLAGQRSELIKYALQAAVSGVQSAAHPGEAFGVLAQCLDLLRKGPQDIEAGTRFAELASNVANRAQRENSPDVVLRTYSLLKKAQTISPIPSQLIARSAIPVAVFIDQLNSFAQLEFFDDLTRLAEQDWDGDTQMNCLIAIYNAAVCSSNEDTAFDRLERMCRFTLAFPQLGPDHCVAGAHKLSTAHPAKRDKIRTLLATALPGALDPDYLAEKGRQWGIDLSYLRDAHPRGQHV